MFLTLLRLLLLVLLIRLGFSLVRWIVARGRTPVGREGGVRKRPAKRPFEGKPPEIEDAEWEEIDEDRGNSG